MPHMSSDQLRDISVSVVESFLNHKVPLSEGLAKQAALNDLNSEQIQRCVEASNTICHLALMGKAEDRTFEFPLCKFAEVMQHAAAPDLEKSAGVMDSLRRAGRAVANTVKDATGRGAAAQELSSAKAGASKAMADLKAAKDLRGTTGTTGTRNKLTDQVHMQWAKNDLASAESRLEKATKAEESARQVAGAKITAGVAGATTVGAAGYIGAKHAQNKMQEKRASDESMPEISEHEAKLHFIKEAAANARIVEDLEARSEVVHAALLKTASEIAKDKLGLDKIACAADADNVPALTSLVYGEARQVRDFGAGRDGLFKAAELKPVTTLQDLYKEARALVAELQHRKELHKRASAMTAELQKEALLASVGRGVGRSLGWAAGKTTATGVKATFGAAKATFGAAKNAIGGVPGKGLGLGAAGLTAGVTLGMNASMLGHDPGYNKVTGQSKDVWNALQN